MALVLLCPRLGKGPSCLQSPCPVSINLPTLCSQGPVNTSLTRPYPQVLGCIQQNKSFLFLNRILITHSLGLVASGWHLHQEGAFFHFTQGSALCLTTFIHTPNTVSKAVSPHVPYDILFLHPPSASDSPSLFSQKVLPCSVVFVFKSLLVL